MSKFSLISMKKNLLDCIGEHNFTTQVDRALEIAYEAHDGQYRESPNGKGKIPYIVHPVGVAINAFKNFSMVTCDDTMEDIISACLTHDVLEDSPFGVIDLEKATSKRTAEIVNFLTKPLIKENLSREERNYLANQKIVDGGVSAMYIKICDHMHNIGRPSATPARLLKKALDKGYQYYLDYFGEGKLPSSLKEVYVSKLEQVSQYLMDHPESASEFEFAKFEDAVVYCDKQVSGKILEIHDIVSVIKQSTGAVSVMLKNKEDFFSEMAASIDTDLKKKWLPYIRKQIENNFLDTSKLPKKLLKIFVCDYYYFVHADLYYGGGAETLVCGYKKNKLFDWVNKTTVDFLLINLSYRLKLHMESKKKDVAEEIARLSLNTDVATIINIGLKYNDLLPLKQWRDNAEVARLNLVSLLSYKIGTNKELPFVQSRVKTVESMLHKVKRRNFESVYSMDDLVGIRVVFLTEQEKERGLLDIVDTLTSNHNLMRSDICIKEMNTTQGYIAKHITFKLNFGDSDRKIPCEIQLKTLFQDAWAKSYRMAAYDIKRSKELKKLFQELSEKCKAADGVIGEVARLEDDKLPKKVP